MAEQEAKKQRATCKRSFTRTEAALRNAIDTAQTPSETIQRRFADLKRTYEEAEKGHDAYLNAKDDDNIDEGEETWINELADRFQKIEVDFDMKIRARSLAETNNTQTGVSAPTISSVQLERLKIQRFEGNIRKYPNFKTSFETHVKPLCNESQLAFVLRSYLSDSVRDDVDSLGDNVDDIWERLDRRFGNQSRLVDIILADVKNIEYCGNDDNRTLNMIKTVERCYSDLKTMKREAEMNNTTIISMIEEKMAPEMTKFGQHRPKIGETANFKPLFQENEDLIG